MFQIVMLYALFASTFSLGKALLSFAQPIFLVGIRMSIAGFILLAYQYFSQSASFRFERKHLSMYVQAILFTCYIPYILRFWGLQYMSSSKASLIYTLGPFITYALGYFLSKEEVTFKKMVGLIIGFFGLMPVLINPTPSEDLMGGIGFFSWAELSIVLSISSLSYGWIVVRKFIKDYNYEPAMINGISMFIGGVLALATSLIYEPQTEIIDPLRFTLILGIIIIVSNLICHNLYGSLLKRYSPTFVSFASFLTPLFAAFYGWVFLHEKISWDFLLSALAVFVGLAIFYQDEFYQKKSSEDRLAELEEL
ncbi:MAG: DMT family transporter [Candidatus Babeliales bacterium]